MKKGGKEEKVERGRKEGKKEEGREGRKEESKEWKERTKDIAEEVLKAKNH